MSALPRSDEAWLESFTTGLDVLARRYGTALVGGDTTAGPLTATVAIAGFVAAILGHSFSCFTGFRGGKSVATIDNENPVMLELTEQVAALIEHYMGNARVLVAGAKAAGPLAALKKDAAVAQAEQLLAGRGWLPDCLRVQPHADAPVTGGEEVDANDPARTEAPACA